MLTLSAKPLTLTFQDLINSFQWSVINKSTDSYNFMKFNCSFLAILLTKDKHFVAKTVHQ